MVHIWLSRALGVQGTQECGAQRVQGTGTVGHKECRALRVQGTGECRALRV